MSMCEVGSPKLRQMLIHATFLVAAAKSWNSNITIQVWDRILRPVFLLVLVHLMIAK